MKIFSLFLACSFFAWFLSNLSESYESRANFTINYRNLPDTLLLGKNATDQIEAKIRTSGFQFLYFNFINKRIDIDASQVVLQSGQYIISEDELKKQMDWQLSQNISLLDFDRNQLVVDLYEVDSREIPIRADLNIQYEPNFILDGELKIDPSHIIIKGPKNEIDTLKGISTSKIELTNISSDFKKEANLILPKGLDNTIYATNRVTVSGKVAKFSERVFEVPVKVLNLPEGYQVKTFPNSVSVLCKATVDRLKEIDAADFEVVSDYTQFTDSKNNTLFLTIKQAPANVYDVKLQENRVNFVLEQL
ncbi:MULTISPECIES: YbbR-like domain-containing protein [Flavobacteriaceae]|uniref:CdaR family protein n=1 Tax=Flavobacteriaceae TaxID=49546 RepID=UPI001490F493|nr:MULTISPECIES: CdaR family protein [Allomuricauda]MDC6364956.1 CdaR family protein [Muricauda sp. AC10]